MDREVSVPQHLFSFDLWFIQQCACIELAKFYSIPGFPARAITQQVVKCSGALLEQT